MANKEQNLVYGVKDGELIYIGDVPSGAACCCTCPECGDALVARKGRVRAWHFAHASGQDCATAAETALHKMAKDYLLSARAMDLPPVVVSDHDLCDDSLVLIGREHVAASDMGAELAFGDVVPDIWFRDMSGRGFFVEIFVTHGIDHIKLQKLRKLGVPTLEADFSEIDRDLSPDEFSKIAQDVFADMRWVYHPVVDAFRALSDTERYVRLHRLRERNIATPKDERCPECYGELSIWWSDDRDCWLGDCQVCGRAHVANKRVPVWRHVRPDLRVCPECGRWMTLKSGRHGEFWGCESFPFCRKTVSTLL